MKTGWQWLFEDHRVDERWFVIQITKRVLYLFVVFNLLYYLIQPLEIGRPTLYNNIFPGRIRMEWTPGGYESLGINELRLSRLFADHVISRPKAQDEYRIVFIGSSEIWGYFNKPQETMPIILDGMGLSALNQRSVRSYNLSYVYSNAVKDMLILDYLLSRGNFDPDLIIWVNTPWTVNPLADPHWLELANPERTASIAERYRLENPALNQVKSRLDVPWWRRHSFFAERDEIAYWLLNEWYGLAWATTGEDLQFPPETTLAEVPDTISTWSIHQTGAFEALVTMAKDHDVRLVLVATPMAWQSPDYIHWLTERSQTLGIPLLDCSAMLPDNYFTDTVLHLNAKGHQLYAKQIALWLKAWWSTPPENMKVVTVCPPHQ